MTREETASMLTLLRVTYPNFYGKMKNTDMQLILDLWAEMFIDEDVNIVKYALKELIATHTGFPPDIAAVKNKIKDLVSTANNEPTDEELWQILKRAASRGYYCSVEEYEKLPAVLKRFVGSPATLREYALIEADKFNTVVHGQFLKQIKVIKEREEYSQRMPADIKLLISAIHKPMIEEPKEPDYNELNERRNKVLNLLEG